MTRCRALSEVDIDVDNDGCLPRVVEELKAFLKDASPKVRSAACEVIIRRKEASSLPTQMLADILPELLHILADEIGFVRYAASSALARWPAALLESHVRVLADLLMHQDSSARKVSCQALSKLSSEAIATHASRLASLLGDVQMEVRLVACSVLPKLPESAFAEFGLLLVQILKDRGVSAALRSAACKAMSEILSKWTSEAVACHSALLAELLDIEELEEAACTTMAKLPQNLLVTHLQRLSVSVLRLSSEVAEEFVDIVSFTQVQDTEVQRAAISIVDRWSHSGWVKALSHQQDLVRAAACRVIVQMPGFVLVHHEKLLTGLLQDWNSSVRASACFALGHLPAALLPAQVVSLLDDLQYEVRQEACLAAAKLPQGALAPCALAVHAPNLAQLMQDDDANLMMAACTTMARLPGHVMARYATQISNALQGFPSLAQEFHGISGWLLHDQLAVQEAACCIMTMWPSEMVAPHIASVVGLLEVLPHIASVLLAKLPVDLLVPHHVKSLSMKLLHIGSDAAERFVGIPGLLDHQNPEVRTAACSIMGLWTPPVLGQHCPKLAKLLQDPAPSVWQAACITLAKFHQQNLDSEVLEAFTSFGGWAGKAMLACRATRSWPQHILQALEQEVGSLAVTPHASRLASLLGDVQMEVRLVACSVLPKLPESAFAEFGLLLVQILKDRGVSAALRSAACKAMSEILSKWTSEAVACRSALLAELLDIEELEEAACTTMAKLPQNLLVTHLQRLSVSVLRLSSEVAEEFVDIVSFTQVQDTEVQRAAISIVDRWSHSGWVKALSHQQDLVRAAACRAIVQMPGSVLVHHEKLLTGLLQDWNSSVRASACFALGHLPAALLPAQVVSLLDDLQYEVRQEACLAAAKLPQGALAPCALAVHAPNLAQLMQDDDANLMMAACTTMARLPGHVMARYATQISNALQGFPSLAQEFHGISGWLLHDQLAVQEAACCIMTMWPSEMVAPHIASVVGLLEVLPHIASVLLAKLPVDLLVPHHVKSLSMKLLHIGSDAAERFVGIPGLLDHQNPEVRTAACSIMGLWTPPVLGQHCPKLAKLLQDPAPSVWQAACITLAKFHQQNLDSEVLEAFTSFGGWAGKAMLACRATRSWPQHILQALEQEVGSLAVTPHASRLASLLGDVQMEVRLVACSVLPKLPESAFAEFGLLLVQILKDRGVSAALRSAACKAMSEILSKWTSEAVACHSALLAELLDIEELEEAACTTMAKLPQNLLVTHLQRLSVSVLRLSSEVAEEFVDIVSFTQVQDTEVQRAAISIVDRWSHSGWVKALSHQQDLVRAAACRAIVQMPGSVLVHHEKLLTGLLQDWNSSVRASACFALGHLPAALLPAQVVSLLDDLQYEVRQEACLAAAKLPQGALAPCALAVHAPNLAQLMQDDDANLRMAACTTMARLPGHVMARYATQISNAFPSLAQEFHGISAWLLHDQLAVQEAACCIMTMWPSEMVAPYIASVVGLLEVLPHIASVLLAKLPVDLLVPHHVKSLSMKLLHIGSDAAERFVGIPGLLDHQNPEVRTAACSIMGLWTPPVLGQHCPKLAELLQDPAPSVWQAACITLAKFHQQNLDSEVLEAFTSFGGWAGKAMLACRATRSWPQHILRSLRQEVGSVVPQYLSRRACGGRAGWRSCRQ